MNTINPVGIDATFVITVTSVLTSRTKCVRINDITQSFDYELSAYNPTYLTESEVKIS